MIPIRDKNPSSITPWVVYALIGINIVVFIAEVSMPDARLEEFMARYGMVPARASEALRGEAGLLGGLIVPLFTSMFMHGGWLHLIGNLWFLHIFGDNVEARLRRVPFLCFYLFCGIAAAAGQWALYPGSAVPMIGASGAIAGVLGAYIVTWPRARIVTLLPLFYFITFVELPAFAVLGMWFLIQLSRGAGSIGAAQGGGVAYWAHIGGFAAGALLVKLLPGRTAQPRSRRREPPGRYRPWH